MKKLRSSQLLSKDILTVSTKLESVERRIDEKSREVAATPRTSQAQIKEELKALQQGRDRLKKQRDILDTRLQEGAILSPQEERRSVHWKRL